MKAANGFAAFLYSCVQYNHMDRRTAVLGLGTLSSGLISNPSSLLKSINRNYQDALQQMEELGKNNNQSEEYWKSIREAYTCAPSMINLNNGGVSPQPRVVQNAVEYYNRMCNEAPSYYMWRVLDQNREPLREKLSALAGCEPGELAINRNSSEALETIIFGLRLQAGDEVVLSKQDYPNMINAWKQRAHRDGIKLVWVNLELPSTNDSYLTESYTSQFTERTRLVHLTHMINWNGQLLPVRKIADAAHKKGIEVLIDGAHTFAHIPYHIPDLGGDYFGASLHKWLSAPFGSGLLYVKRDKIKNLYPLFAAGDPEQDDIRKFENLGTRSMAIEHAIAHAIDFYDMIGVERKYERLYELQKYWTQQLADDERFIINHPKASSHSGALGNIAIKDKKVEEVANRLFDQYKIHAVSINWENIHGVRITPNVYTLKSELDKLVRALKTIANS